MLNKISTQTAQGIGSLLGQMFGGGVGQKDYAQGQLMGTQIREHKAKAALDEQQYSSIAEAIKAGVANNFKDANVYSLYGGKGTTSFDVTNQGAVFNKLTGGLNEDTSVTHAFLKLKQAEANNQNLQGDYYRSRSETERGLLNERERELIAKAALDEARAKDVTSMIAPKQKFILSQAFEKYAQGNQHNSVANYNNARANDVNTLTPSKVQGILASSFEKYAQGNQHNSVANYNNARANDVYMPVERKAGSYYVNPNGGGVSYLPKLGEGLAFENGQVQSIGGFGESKTTTVSDTEYAKGRAKSLAKTYQGFQDSAAAASVKLSQINRMSDLMAGLDGGKYTPLGVEIASAANSLGLSIDPNLGNKEAAEALANELALGMHKAGTGAMTDRDFAVFKASIPSLAKSEQGNIRIMETLRAFAKRQIEEARMANEYQQRVGRIDDNFISSLNDWRTQNPIFAGNQALNDAGYERFIKDIPSHVGQGNFGEIGQGISNYVDRTGAEQTQANQYREMHNGRLDSNYYDQLQSQRTNKPLDTYAPSSNPVVAEGFIDRTPNAVLQQAREAIAKGANRAEVIRRLESLGVNPQGL